MVVPDVTKEIEYLCVREGYVAVNKPRFVHSAKGQGFSMEELVQSVSDMPQKGELLLLNRLDFETSGILFFSKESCGERNWKEAFKEGAVEKKYLALVEGKLEMSKLVKGYVGGRYRHSKKVSFSEKAKSRLSFAESVVTPLAHSSDQHYTLVGVRTHFGRRHQVRVHCTALGHPLGGDVLYGGGPVKERDGFFLHAGKVSALGIEVTAPLFDEFISVLHELSISLPERLWDF
jgi:23S rRNA-/tRNA-specific pseudouridylate synthase